MEIILQAILFQVRDPKISNDLEEKNVDKLIVKVFNFSLGLIFVQVKDLRGYKKLYEEKIELLAEEESHLVVERDHALEVARTKVATRDLEIDVVNVEIAKHDASLEVAKAKVAQKDQVISDAHVELASTKALVESLREELVKAQATPTTIGALEKENAKLI
ncbi:hypothetical protein ACFE04_023833 [Oxalis oulophora]